MLLITVVLCIAGVFVIVGILYFVWVLCFSFLLCCCVCSAVVSMMRCIAVCVIFWAADRLSCVSCMGRI